MKKNLLLFILLIMLSGCKQNEINIRHESTGQEFQKQLQQANSNKSVVKKSSGIIIFKDNSSSYSNNNINFGPKDMDFDLKFKFK